jgi:hypothetical protein
MLIADTAGMATHLSMQIKQKISTHWVVRSDLNDHNDALET